MFTYLSRHRAHLTAAARPRRITAALAAAALGLLAWAAAAPAASARVLPPDGPAGAVIAPPPVIHVVTGGMPGWQITLIAVAAALVTATAAVLLDRARASRRSAPSVG
jgi:hypothetical protein